MAFTKRLIEVNVELASGTGTTQVSSFIGGLNSYNITGLRTSVRIVNSGSPVGCEAQVRVWGLNQSLMNQFSTLGLVFNQVPKNVLTVNAGDEETGLSAVFRGTILYAYGDYSNQPDVPFIFDCYLGAAESTAQAKSSSFTGSTDVKTIISGIARQMGFSFRDYGVNVKLSKPYLYGSLWDQLDRVARHANISWGIEGANTVAIWEKGKNKDTPSVPLVSPATGMIDYPAFTQQGIIVKTLFNPEISFGGLIRVESDVLAGIGAANAQINFPTQWAVNKLDLHLDSQVPKGQWMSVIHAYNPGYSRAIIPPVR